MLTVQYKGQEYQVGGDPRHETLPLPAWYDPQLEPRWRELEPREHGWLAASRGWGRSYLYKGGALLVLVSCARYADGKHWLHVSVSRRDKVIPTWEQMAEVKRLFIGEERQAIQVMPRASKYVNMHAGCLHMWHCLDGDDFLPDFTGGGETI